MSLKSSGYVLLLAILLQACVKEKVAINEDTIVPNLNPSLAIPIAEVNMTVEEAYDLNEDDNIQYNSDLEYYEYHLSKSLFYFSANEILDIEPQSLQETYQLDAGTQAIINAAPVGDVVIANPINLEYEYVSSFGALMDSILVEQGQMQLTINNSYRQDMVLILEIPGVTLNGVSLKDTIEIDYNGVVPISVTRSYNLDENVIDMTNNGTTSNFLEIIGQSIVTTTGETVAATDNITGTLNFAIQNFHSAFGYFGQYSGLLDATSTDIELFDLQDGGELFIAAPRIDVTIENSSGVDVEVNIDDITTTGNGGTTVYTGPDLSNIPLVEGADVIGDIIFTTHTINNNGVTPPLSSLIEDDPEEILFNSSGITNPDGPTDNFILSDSYISGYSEVVLPFFGYAHNFTATDTVELDVNELIDDAFDNPNEVVTDEDVEQITIRLVIDNGLPIGGNIQGYFIDSLGTVIDSVFQTDGLETIIEAGLVDFSLDPSDPDYGRVFESSRKVTDFVITNEQITTYQDLGVTDLIIKGLAKTDRSEDQLNVRIYPDNTIFVKVSAKVDFNLDLNE